MFPVGLNLDLVCRVDLISAVDSPLDVSSVWTRDGIPVVSNDATNARDFQITGNNPAVFESIIEFRPLTKVENNTNYTCDITIVAQNITYIFGTNVTVSTNLTVEDFPFQVVQLPSEVTLPAGSPHILSCVISRSTGLMDPILEVGWLEQDGSPVRNGENGITISGPLNTTASTLTSSLVFTNVMTSHGGNYTCSVNLTIPGTEIINYNIKSTTSLRVQIPSPQVAITPSRNNPHYEGTTLDITCTIIVNLTGVDTAVMLDRVFTGTTRDVSAAMEGNVIVSQTFDPLGLPNGGLFTCSATVDSTSDVPKNQFIVSLPVWDIYSLNVSALPVPMVTVSPSSLTILSGQSSALICTVTVVDKLVVVPYVQWRGVDGQEVDGVIVNTSRKQISSILMLPAFQTSQVGLYTCKASIDIPSVNIVDHSSSNEIFVYAQIPPPQVSIDPSTKATYHGTNYNLTCTIGVDSSVSTLFTLDVVWRYLGTQLQNSGNFDIIPPTLSDKNYTSILMFTPLNLPDLSSGDYRCGVTVQPDNNTFISPASGSGTINLEVLAAPAPVVTTDVPEKPLTCEETRFTCDLSLVDNFVAIPTVVSIMNEWLDPDNNLVRNSSNETLNIQNGGSSVFAGNYTCRACVNVPKVGIINLCGNTTVKISFIESAPVENLSCPVSLSSNDTLTVSWSPPTETAVVLVGYQVEIRQYVSSGGRQVALVELIKPFTRNISSLNMSVHVPGLEPFVRYQISVMGVTKGGCDVVNTVECYTEEGMPLHVQGVAVDRFSDNQMNVSWTPLTIVEARGFLHSYIVTYSSGDGSRHKRQGDPDQSSICIDNLDARMDYNVTVTAQTTSGTQSLVSLVVRAGQLLFALFQLRLTPINNCSEWVTVDQPSRKSIVSETVVAEVESRCNCGFIRANIAEESFRCFSSSKNAVTYRAKIVQTKSLSLSGLIDIISQWIAEDGFVIMLPTVVDKNCNVSISSFTDTECTSPPADTAIVGGGPADITIVGGVVGSCVVVMIISITIIVLVIVFLVFKSRQAKLTLEHTNEHRNQLPEVSLCGVTSSGNIEDNEMVDQEHEYEDVSQYHQKEADHGKSSHFPLVALQSDPPPLPLRENYELTECSAYHTILSPPPPTLESENYESHGSVEVTACIAYQTTSLT